MWKLFRFINRNLTKIIVVIIILVFALSLIQIINYQAGNRTVANNKKIEENQAIKNSVTNTYENQSESMVSQGDLKFEEEQQLGGTLDSFLQSCINGNYEQAYNLLSNDCKEVLYPSLDLFVQQYCSKYAGNKQYSFQSWTSQNSYIYYVKIFDNMLLTGKNYDSYLEEYISLIPDEENENSYKLNVNGFLGSADINKTSQRNNIRITVEKSYVFMNNQKFTIKVENLSDKPILLDTRNSNGTVCVVDSNRVEFDALLYENQDDDFVIDANKYKIIDINFSNNYRDNVSIDKMIFKDIVSNYENNTISSDERLTIEIYM